MRRNYKILSILLSIALLFSNIAMPVGATGMQNDTVSENEVILDTAEEITETGIKAEETVVEPVEAETTEEATNIFDADIAQQKETTANATDYEIYINPEYKDIFSQEELEAELEEIKRQYAEKPVGAKDSSYFTTEEEVGSYLRAQMVARSTTVVCTIPYSLITENEDFNAFCGDVINIAVAYTEECSGQEGDALASGYKSIEASGSGTSDQFQLTFTISYHTTAEQEAELTTKVNSIMSELALDGKTEYEKIKAIHDYICDNVDYDYSYTKYSAYEALCNGTAVCQGYALAFYRLCKENGLSVRYISGIGNGGRHGWNIVRIGDVYYNIDCTWDGQDPETNWDWFLLNEIDFVDHARDEKYATTEFYATYPMATESYGKETPSGYNLDNLTYTFTTIEDETISSTANGKPKLLIFFKADCWNSRNTIKSLADYELDGVDIYALEAEQNSKSTVEEFANEYGNETIIFSYDIGSDNSSPMWQYIRTAFPGTTSTTYPVICYIDANNKFQYLTTGISGGAQIANLLKLTCGYTETQYTITYYLDGGTNHADNPSLFTAGTETIILKDPNKTGYAFKGWYRDAEFTQQVMEIAKGTKQNIELYAKFVKGLDLQIPNKTTYVIEEELDLTGGKITNNETGNSVDLKSSMISGFDSTEEGICTVTVTYENNSTTFNVLVIGLPVRLEAAYGQTLDQVTLPENAYGVYSWNNGEQKLETTGKNRYELTFTPGDENSFSVRDDLTVEVSVNRTITEAYEIILKTQEFVYDGKEHRPEVEVLAGTEVVSPENYIVEYTNNINAGTATVTITGQNGLSGSKSTSFTIQPAALTITANNMTIRVGDVLPGEVAYTVDGLAEEDALVKEPEVTYTAVDTSKTGIYEIILSGAEATANYNPTITYVNGILTIAEENVGYNVTFDVQGHGVAPDMYVGVKAGGVIEKPIDPVAEGYVFAGWYKNSACTKEWNFETDTVQEDITLYAKWIIYKEDSFSVSEIADVTYTGKAMKPAVKVYDGETLLKANKDYKITYYNNTNVNQRKAGNAFDEKLPYVVITGKGNYTDTIKINFNILPVEIADGTKSPATDIKLSYSEQLIVNPNKAVSPFKSIKYKKNMIKDVDYTVTLAAVSAKDASGNILVGNTSNGMIPAGSSGEFILQITGKGNYEGIIEKTIYVADTSHLVKNTKITLGNNLKKIDFDYYKNTLKKELQAAYYDKETNKYYAVKNGTVDYNTVLDASNVFTVRYGNTSLIYQKDFTISYLNNSKVGTATMVIRGIGDYVGSKTITFRLVGKTFNAKNVTVKGLADKTYTGKPITQNDVVLTYTDGTRLVYGTDYKISYAKHINKGKATITFTAIGDSGYQGSFKKTFNILAVPMKDVIQDESMQSISVAYEKEGAKPVDKVILKNSAGVKLVYGKDYTITCKNNKVVATSTAEKAPTLVIKGKGNYGGNALEVRFTITKASLNNENISVSVKEMAYNSQKADTYEYKPAVSITDGKKKLSPGKDYVVQYVKNTQADYKAYYMDKTVFGEENMPRAVITTPTDSSYELDAPIVLPLPIYQNKLTKNNIRVEVEKADYTGKQVTPKVSVYYMSANGEIQLKENENYTLSYGANVVAGKNKGTVKISGAGFEYGGSVTVKFDINSKKIVW